MIINMALWMKGWPKDKLHCGASGPLHSMTRNNGGLFHFEGVPGLSCTALPKKRGNEYAFSEVSYKSHAAAMLDAQPSSLHQ